MMNHDDLDRTFSQEEEIVPSPGFAISVMNAVRREASSPPAIPFPWKWALPGLAAWISVLVLFVVAIRAQIGAMTLAAPVLQGTGYTGAEWIGLALLLAFASVTLSMRLVGART